MILSKNVLWFAGFSAICLVAHAGDSTMSFHGTLLTPPSCTINDGQQIEVNFGARIGIHRVDGVNYRQSLNYQITCNTLTHTDWALTLSLSGVAAGFDKEALLTNQPNLAIRIYQNNKPFAPGNILRINLANPPKLTAVPVKKEGTELTEGAFEAWATLRAEYQ
ncbi:fimbrial protein [Serratia marcescens]|uniref:fimbrial protein n=1 Tax=Serratia marcescens TaxID=615 RepID=UPI000C13DF8D|nr:fimbrial protein [Serratia marcescens]PHY73474.1 pilus assembly protein [Serratia marcescens]PIC08955.1 pilus assembly protein [Serratia marcescens]